jgi:hypothetical protein
MLPRRRHSRRGESGDSVPPRGHGRHFASLRMTSVAFRRSLGPPESLRTARPSHQGFLRRKTDGAPRLTSEEPGQIPRGGPPPHYRPRQGLASYITRGRRGNQRGRKGRSGIHCSGSRCFRSTLFRNRQRVDRISPREAGPYASIIDPVATRKVTLASSFRSNSRRLMRQSGPPSRTGHSIRKNTTVTSAHDSMKRVKTNEELRPSSNGFSTLSGERNPG